MNYKTIDNTLHDMASDQNLIILAKARCDKAKHRADQTFTQASEEPRKRLEKTRAKLEALCDKNHEEIGTSQKRTAGEIGFKKPGPTVDFTLPEKDVVKKLIDADQNDFVRFGDPKVDKTEVKKQFKNEDVTARELKKFGVVVTNEPQFFYKLNTTNPT